MRRVRVIAYHPDHARILGHDAAAATVLGQILYWCDPSKKRLRIRHGDHLWLRKTYEELAEETGLTPRKVRSAVEKIERCGIIITETLPYHHGKCLHIRVDFQRFTELLDALTGRVLPKPADRSAKSDTRGLPNPAHPPVRTKDYSESTCMDYHHQTPHATIYPTPAKRSDAPAASAVVALLMQQGMVRSNAERIACEYSEQHIRQQVEWLPHRKAENPGALLYKAIVEGWSAPPEWEQTQEKEREREEQQQRNAKLAEREEQQRQAAAELQARLEAAWLALSGQQRAELEQQAEERFRVENGTLANWLDDPEKRKSPWVTGPLNTIRKDLLRTRYFTAVE